VSEYFLVAADVRKLASKAEEKSKPPRVRSAPLQLASDPINTRFSKVSGSNPINTRFSKVSGSDLINTRLSRASGSDLINTPLQRGESCAATHRNRFNGFSLCLPPRIVCTPLQLESDLTNARFSRASGSDLINTPLQRGESCAATHKNRFNGFSPYLPPRIVLALTILILVFGGGQAFAQPSRTAPDKKEVEWLQLRRSKWTDAFSIWNSEVRVELVPEVGGRILEYAFGGENILYQPPGVEGQTLETRKREFSVGGYQCDIGPEIRGIPEHANLWLGNYTWNLRPGSAIELTSRRELGIQLSKEFIFDPDSGDLGITQRMKNVSALPASYCLWDRTVCRGGGFAFFPLSTDSRFPARWSIRRTVDGRFIYDGKSPSSTNVQILGGILIAKAKGEATKIGADTRAEWIAYVRGRLLFIKYFPWDKKGSYTDGGNTVELYWDQETAELEPLSPEVKLAPGQSCIFPEKWALHKLDKEITSFAQVREIVGRIPPSPFQVASR